MSLDSLVQKVAASWSVTLTPADLDRLVRLFGLLLTWNARINLTGAKSPADLVGQHLPDSLAMIRLVPAGARVVDVGSGAGLPALPFAVVRPDAVVTLVEPRAKKAAFLRAAIREAQITHVEVIARRVEDLGPAAAMGGDQAGPIGRPLLFESAFDVASSRATFPPSEWLARGLPLIRAGGRVLVFSTAALPAASLPPRARLAEDIAYRTSTGQERWAGAYCFTWNVAT